MTNTLCKACGQVYANPRETCECGSNNMEIVTTAERNKMRIPLKDLLGETATEKPEGDWLLGPATCSANHPTCKYCIYTKMPHPPGSWCYMFKAGTRVNRGDKIWCAKYEGVCQGCGMKLTVVVDDLCATCAGNRRGAQPDERKNQ